MRILLAGASGFLGTALADHLASSGHQVARLVRREPTGPDEHRWDPDAAEVDQALVDAQDAVVCLSGAPIARWPWSASYRAELLRSRVRTTELLARAVAQSPQPPALVVGSGMAVHGDDRGDEWLDEGSSDGPGFLADVVRAWEQAADPARDAGARVVHLRTGVVLHRDGGALATMLLPFRFGLGGRLGSGQQYFSVISRSDWVRAASFLIEHDTAAGPYNLVGVDPPTNATYTRALGHALHRPAVLWVPATPLKIALGGLASELLGSLRMRPARLVEAGFEHQHRDVDEVLQAALHD